MSQNNQHKIGLMGATIICMNAMIGAGIFTTPAKLALSVGPAGIITYAFVIVAVLFMALSLARVAQIYPEEGAFYTYTKQWGGHAMGILAAGAYIFAVIIALGLITQMAAEYLHAFLPAISTNIFGILIISTIVALNVIGVRIMQLGQLILLCCTLFALISTTLLCLFNANTSNLTPFMPFGWSSLASATSAAIFAFFGFESATSLFPIVENPTKNIPKALTYSLLIVGLIYVSFISAIILAIPREIFTSTRMPISDAIIGVFPQYAWLAKLIGFAILTSFLGVLQSMTYSIATLMFSFFKLTNLKSVTQHKNSFQLIVIAIGLFTLFNFYAIKSMGLFFNLTALFIIFAFITSILTLVIKKHDKTLNQKITTILGLSTAVIIFLNALNGTIEEITKLF